MQLLRQPASEVNRRSIFMEILSILADFSATA